MQSEPSDANKTRNKRQESIYNSPKIFDFDIYYAWPVNYKWTEPLVGGRKTANACSSRLCSEEQEFAILAMFARKTRAMFARKTAVQISRCKSHHTSNRVTIGQTKNDRLGRQCQICNQRPTVRWTLVPTDSSLFYTAHRHFRSHF